MGESLPAAPRQAVPTHTLYGLTRDYCTAHYVTFEDKDVVGKQGYSQDL